MPLSRERIAELRRQFVVNEEERVCNRCDADYSAGSDGFRDEHSALCDKCAQEFISAELPELLAAAERDLDVQTLDDRAVKRGENVPQVQRELRDVDGIREWGIFINDGSGGRLRLVAHSPASARHAAALAIETERKGET